MAAATVNLCVGSKLRVDQLAHSTLAKQMFLLLYYYGFSVSEIAVTVKGARQVALTAGLVVGSKTVSAYSMV